MTRHPKKLKLRKILKIAYLRHLNKIYMPNATPTPTQIVIQKVGAVIISKP
jgi:hypothetical protein